MIDCGWRDLLVDRIFLWLSCVEAGRKEATKIWSSGRLIGGLSKLGGVKFWRLESHLYVLTICHRATILFKQKLTKFSSHYEEL